MSILVIHFGLQGVCGRAFVNLLLFYISATNHFLPIHREAPAFVEQATEQQILVTGIKVGLFSSRAKIRFGDMCLLIQ